MPFKKNFVLFFAPQLQELVARGPIKNTELIPPQQHPIRTSGTPDVVYYADVKPLAEFKNPQTQRRVSSRDQTFRQGSGRNVLRASTGQRVSGILHLPNRKKEVNK